MNAIDEPNAVRTDVEPELIAALKTAEAVSRRKSDFLANICHEIRTPLTAILGYTDLLLDNDLTAEERAEFLGTIKRSGNHLMSLINDFLDLSKIESGITSVTRIPVSPADVIHEVLSSFAESARTRNLSLRAEVDGYIPRTISTDPARLRQILFNLIGNAVKFTESGGITVVVRLDECQTAVEPRLAIDVRDTGIGISDEHQANLFTPFAQADQFTSRKYGGTGLGLSIARRMAQSLGGDITVTSAIGRGSRFTVTVATGNLYGVDLFNFLPNTLENQLPKPPAIRLGGRILLAEDDPASQRLISTLLIRAGAVVEVVDNGQIVVERVIRSLNRGTVDDDLQSLPHYDLILLDMQMPILDGCSTATELRSRGYAGPMIALTANVLAADRNKCLTSGCDDFVSKPIDRHQLLQVCRQWLSPVPDWLEQSH